MKVFNLSLLACVFSVSNGNNTSSQPSNLVEYVHNFPHMDFELHPVSNNFDVYIDNQWTIYTQSVITFPLSCLAFIIIGVVALQICILMRYVNPHFQCVPEKREKHLYMALHQENGMNRIVHSRSRTLKYFLCFLVLFFSIIQVFLVGIFLVGFGAEKVISSIKNIDDTFSGLIINGNNLDFSTTTLDTSLNSAVPTCPEADNIRFDVDIAVLESCTRSYQYIVDPIPDQVNECRDLIHEYGIAKTSNIGFATYGTVILLILLYVMALLYARIPLAMKSMIGVSELCIIALGAINLCLMVMMMYTADFCMDPDNNVLKLVHENNLDVTSYYVSCQGANPIDKLIKEILLTSSILNQSIHRLVQPGGDCNNNPYLLQALTNINCIHTNATEIQANSICEPIQNDWNDAMEDGLCSKAFNGIFTLWIAVMIAILFLYGVTIFGSILYLYFGPLWGKFEPQEVEWLRLIIMTGTDNEYEYMERIADGEGGSARPLLSNIPWYTYDKSFSYLNRGEEKSSKSTEGFIYLGYDNGNRVQSNLSVYSED